MRCTMSVYPLRFHPILKPKVWGGRRLERFGKHLPPETAADAKIGESWELADLPDSVADGRSVIANGPLAGLTLREAIAKDARAIMGSATPTTCGAGGVGFPLLIKFLDAEENLSVQVHPDTAYAAKHPQAHLKSEAWIVMDADPGAVIYKGVKPGVTRDRFAKHIEDGTAADALVAIPAKRGDCHYLPSGTVHALGAGVLVAEVQTPSDTTFRVYDWGRTGRTLHVEQALQCINFASPNDEQDRSRKPIVTDGLSSTTLVDTEFFAIERLETSGKKQLDLVTSNQPVVWMMLAGHAVIHSPKAPSSAGHVEMSTGETVLLPAALEDASIELAKGATALRISLPSPTRGKMA
jgi:mannose-6-phosphate isomerase